MRAKSCVEFWYLQSWIESSRILYLPGPFPQSISQSMVGSECRLAGGPAYLRKQPLRYWIGSSHNFCVDLSGELKMILIKAGALSFMLDYKSPQRWYSVLSSIYHFRMSLWLRAKPCRLKGKLVHQRRFIKVKPSNMRINHHHHLNPLANFLTPKDGITRDLT